MEWKERVLKDLRGNKRALRGVEELRWMRGGIWERKESESGRSKRDEVEKWMAGKAEVVGEEREEESEMKESGNGG